MRDATRRNKNIGTSNQGHGQNNKMIISEPALIMKSFYERLVDYEKITKNINGHDFIFVIEKTRKTSLHACTVIDIENIIKVIPAKDYGFLKFIVFRQPKRKEELLSPVWGRFIYSYEFEREYFPAIIIEAIDYQKKFKWTKNLSIDGQKELERLRQDGHKIKEDKRYFTAEYIVENVRKTQLYRTLLHEFGHYVHYLENVERFNDFAIDMEVRDKMNDYYFKQLPASEKEKFAHNYADKMRKHLIDNNIIPFDRIEFK
jgi:hypothetical protein